MNLNSYSLASFILSTAAVVSVHSAPLTWQFVWVNMNKVTIFLYLKELASFSVKMKNIY